MEEKRKILTLCMVQQGSKVLLGFKKRGFGQGKWIGFGGKVEAGETIEQAAIRELQEESGLIAKNLEQFAINEFRFEYRPGEVLEVHFFRTTKFEGELQESGEMKPEWFNQDSMPFDQMWDDDRYWFGLFLAGKKFKGDFLFDNSEKIIKHRITEIEGF